MPQIVAMALFHDPPEHAVHRRIIGMDISGLEIGPRQLQLFERIWGEPVQHLLIAAVQIIDFGWGQAIIDLLDEAVSRRIRGQIDLAVGGLSQGGGQLGRCRIQICLLYTSPSPRDS